MSELRLLNKYVWILQQQENKLIGKPGEWREKPGMEEKLAEDYWKSNTDDSIYKKTRSWNQINTEKNYAK